MECEPVRGVEPRSPDNRLAPARDEQAHQESNPVRRGWSSPCFRYTMGLLVDLGASGRSRTRTSAVQRARAAVDTTEALTSGDGGNRTRSSSVQARCSATRASSPSEAAAGPGAARCGRVESNHHSSRRPDYSRVSSPGAQRPREGVTGRARTGAAGITAPDASHYTTVTTCGHFSWRLCRLRAVTGTGTTGLEPAASRLTSERSARPFMSYAPFRDVNGRSGSTASSSMSRPLRLDRRRDESGWQESNLRSPAPEAGGVASSPTARCPTSAARPARGA